MVRVLQTREQHALAHYLDCPYNPYIRKENSIINVCRLIRCSLTHPFVLSAFCKQLALLDLVRVSLQFSLPYSTFFLIQPYIHKTFLFLISRAWQSKLHYGQLSYLSYQSKPFSLCLFAAFLLCKHCNYPLVEYCGFMLFCPSYLQHARMDSQECTCFSSLWQPLNGSLRRCH